MLSLITENLQIEDICLSVPVALILALNNTELALNNTELKEIIFSISLFLNG